MSLPHASLTPEPHGSAFRYAAVWLLLTGLALASYLLSRAHLGGLDIVLALVIAVAKTTLVLLFFMELIEHRFVNTLVLLVSASLVLLLLSLMVSDVVTRHTFPRGPLPVVDETSSR